MEYKFEDVYPVGKRLLVEPFSQATETSEGLEISDGDGHATPVLGTVIRAGEGCSFKEKDVVFFRRYAIDVLKVPSVDGTDRTLYILEESEVIANVRGEVELPKKRGQYTQINEKQNEQKENSEESSTKKGSKKGN